MILVWLIVIPLIGGILAWIAERWSTNATRWVALLTTTAQFVLALILWGRHWHAWQQAVVPGRWLVDLNVPWISQVSGLDIHFHLALDGIGMVLILLTGLVGILSVVASWSGVEYRRGLFFFNLLWTLTGITGVFVAVDLFLFYLFWELMLIPLYFLIDIWGHERRHYAAIKFLIFTQLGGLFLLLGILGLVFEHGRATGVYSFDYFTLLGTPLPFTLAFWLMLGFFIAFAVKLPVVPVHTWLPDAHTQAPAAGSVQLAGLILKVGAFGMLRFVFPLFPAAAFYLVPAAMILAVVGILYGAIQAFGQTDLKRLVAYTSISHMGFVLLGIFAWNELSIQGALIVIVAHGLSTGALFALVGAIENRLHTRRIDHMGGLWTIWPRLSGIGLFLAIASLGLPGLANFVGEFLVLLGTFRVAPIYAIIGSGGFIVSVIYSVWIVYRVFWGPVKPGEEKKGTDLPAGEMAMYLLTAALIVLIGIYPQPLLNTAAASVRSMLGLASQNGSTYVEHGVTPALLQGGDHDLQ